MHSTIILKGKYRADRGNGACSSSGPIKRRVGAFRGIHFIWKKIFLQNEKIAKHEDWVKELLEKYPDINAENIQAILQKEVGLVFVHVLEDAGVYKCTPKGREDFMRFVDSL